MLLVCLLVKMLFEPGDSICDRPVNSTLLEATQTCEQAVDHNGLLRLHLPDLFVLRILSQDKPIDCKDRTEDDDE